MRTQKIVGLSEQDQRALDMRNRIEAQSITRGADIALSIIRSYKNKEEGCHAAGQWLCDQAFKKNVQWIDYTSERMKQHVDA